eukprot:TRINITY_DN8471_c0_g1_i2.p1 TRINITY_DN8471_c0_g1~~TRINITY_DN8471_c0_g1_i2.p1  ORF type:complete len:250 (-),score=59.66 TRINITY_DN8471_c0_g1_i2:85-834(-)
MQKVALIVGAGPGIGSCVAKKFARQGYQVCVARRNQDQLESLVKEIEDNGGKCNAFGCDMRKEEEVRKLVEHVENNIGPIGCGVHNIGANIGHISAMDTSTRVYTKVWEMATLSAFLFGREVGSRMVQRGHGTIIYTGATASLRGSAGHSAFSSAKMAKRALAQSLAREFGPLGVHVAHVVVDGAVDNPNTKKFFGEKDPKLAKMFEEKGEVGGLVDPNDVAETYWHLHNQGRTAWTHEVDLRPWVEKW